MQVFEKVKKSQKNLRPGEWEEFIELLRPDSPGRPSTHNLEFFLPLLKIDGKQGRGKLKISAYKKTRNLFRLRRDVKNQGEGGTQGGTQGYGLIPV